MDIKIEGFYEENADYYQHVIDIRSTVFVKELGFDKHFEFDGKDNIATHYIILYDSIPVGCARWIEIDNSLVIDRFCISKAYRKRGLAIVLIKFIISELLPAKKQILLQSLTDSIVFFTQMGFRETGQTTSLGKKRLNILKFTNG